MKINEAHSVLRFYLINILITFTSVAIKNCERKQVSCSFGEGLPKASDQKLGDEKKRTSKWANTVHFSSLLLAVIFALSTSLLIDPTIR